MPVYSRTFFALKKAIWRAANDLEREGTATGGSATSLIDTALTDATDSRLKGVNVYIGNGTAQSRETRGTAFTAGSDTITVPSGTAMASGSEYALSRRFTNTEVTEALRMALAAMGRYSKPWEDQSLIAGSPLVNATFYDGSGTFPNGWTIGGTGGTFAQQSGTGVTKHGRFACRITSNGTNACSIAQNVPNPGRYRGLSVQTRAWIRNATGNTVGATYMQLADGITTQKNAIPDLTTRGWGSEEFTTTAFTVSDRATVLTVTIGVDTDAANTNILDVSGVWITPRMPNEWAIPAGSPTSIHRIMAEDYQEGPFGTLIARDAQSIVYETTRRLRLDASIPLGRILHLQGRTSWADFATAASDDDTAFDGLWPWLVPAAAYNLLLTKPRQEDIPLLDRLKAYADSLQPSLARMPPGSLIVEPN